MALPAAAPQRGGTPIVLGAAVTDSARVIVVCSIVLFTAALGGSGCIAAEPSQVKRWADDHGGTLKGASANGRAERGLARLTESGAIQRRLTVAVLDTDDVGAYCWRSGAIYLTRGLIERLEDDELCAAIAHEAGHLLVDGHMPRAAALDGCRRACGAGEAEDSEIAADLMGRELLRMSAVPEQALTRLLGKLATNPANSSTCRDHLARRIAALGAPRTRTATDG